MKRKFIMPLAVAGALLSFPVAGVMAQAQDAPQTQTQQQAPWQDMTGKDNNMMGSMDNMHM